MAVTMELEESVSDSKLHKDSAAKKELRPSSAVSFSKSDNGAILCAGTYIPLNNLKYIFFLRETLTFYPIHLQPFLIYHKNRVIFNRATQTIQELGEQ